MDDFPCKDTPVIVLTANAIQGAKEMYINEGFDDFLSKPIQPEKLERMIKEWLPQELLLEDSFNENVTKANIDLPQIDGIDWKSAMTHLPDKELLLQTVYDFYCTMNSEADFLQNCYENLDEDATMLDSYRIKVHAMKSSAALIGINGLSENAKILEFAAKDGNKELIQERTEDFLAEWREYKEKLSVCVAEGEKIIVDTSVITMKLGELREAMDMMDIDMADEIIKELRSYQYSDEIITKIESLEAAVINLDVLTASDVIDEIIQLM